MIVYKNNPRTRLSEFLYVRAFELFLDSFLWNSNLLKYNQRPVNFFSFFNFFLHLLDYLSPEAYEHVIQHKIWKHYLR